MRALLQRVNRGCVTEKNSGEILGKIGNGVVVFLGMGHGDTPRVADWLADKIATLRLFEDAAGKINLSCREVNGNFLVVSQFTLYGDCHKGRRPSFTDAASPELARQLYEHFVTRLREHGFRVETGKFQADMLVEIFNDGPVTLWLEETEKSIPVHLKNL